MTTTTTDTFTIPREVIGGDDRTLVALLLENTGPDGAREDAIAARFTDAEALAAADAGQVRAVHLIDHRGRDVRKLVYC